MFILNCNILVDPTWVILAGHVSSPSLDSAPGTAILSLNVL